MKVIFTDKKIKAPETLKAYAEKKVNKLERYFSTDATAYVTFSIEKGRHKVEITVHNGKMFFRASESTNDMYASIDSAIAAIERQIHKNKTRLEKRLRSTAFDKGSYDSFDYGSETEEEAEFDIVRVKRFPIKPMTPEEAILQMNLLGHSFYVFKNQNDNSNFAVVYVRDSGGYGLIQSED